MFVLATTLVTMVLASGVALAANRIECRDQDDGRCAGTFRADEMIGTNRAGTIRGLGGDDLIEGRGGSDKLIGARGGDQIIAGPCAPPDGVQSFGGRGDDVTVADDCGDLTVVRPPDTVDCGSGEDVVRGDKISADCERVIRA
jgi:hypothetical protein